MLDTSDAGTETPPPCDRVNAGQSGFHPVFSYPQLSVGQLWRIETGAVRTRTQSGQRLDASG
jgi:hypothetical protein